jgi:hypothetical protein
MFHLLFDRAEPALQAAKAASQAARKANLPSILSLAIQSEAQLHLARKDFGQTWAVLFEAFAVIENEPLHAVVRSCALAKGCGTSPIGRRLSIHGPRQSPARMGKLLERIEDDSATEKYEESDSIRRGIGLLSLDTSGSVPPSSSPQA